MGRAFTDVQELKQVPWQPPLSQNVHSKKYKPWGSLVWTNVIFEVSAGTDIVRKTMSAFCVPSAKMVGLVDLHGYDGSTALAAIEAGFLLDLIKIK